jgi:hypothetical protein
VPAAFQRMMSTPWPLPRMFVRLIRAVSRCDPTPVVMAAGTVGVTALSMAGRGGGWGLAPAGQSLLLIVAARFVQRLVDLIEGGYGLVEEEEEEEEDAQDAPGPAASSG